MGTLIALGLGEWLARVHLQHVLGRTALFRNHQVLGWAMEGNQEVTWTTSEGKEWQIKTNEAGLRSYQKTDPPRPTMLILGDSFAFGQGVNQEERFDERLAVHHQLHALNTGVMGYGTDQQYLSAITHLDQLGEGDLVIWLTYFNDFFDIAMRRNNGRAKPFARLSADSIVWEAPVFNTFDHIREHSALFSRLARLIAGRAQLSEAEMLQSTQRYQRIVQELATKLHQKQVPLLVVMHGLALCPDILTESVHSMAVQLDSQPGVQVYILQSLNYHLTPNYYQEDGHWSAAGHEQVANELQSLIGTTRGAYLRPVNPDTTSEVLSQSPHN